MIAVFRPLKDRAVLTVWLGLCASTRSPSGSFARYVAPVASTKKNAPSPFLRTATIVSRAIIGAPVSS